MNDAELLSALNKLPKEELLKLLKTSTGKKSPGRPRSREKGERHTSINEQIVPCVHTYHCRLCGSVSEITHDVIVKRLKSGPVFVGPVRIDLDGCQQCYSHFMSMTQSEAISTLLDFIRLKEVKFRRLPIVHRKDTPPVDTRDSTYGTATREGIRSKLGEE